MLIEIDATKCKKDRLCVIECPFNCLVEGEDGVPSLDAEMEQYCMRCGHCVSVCPAAAVTLEGVAPEGLTEVAKEPPVAPAAMKALLDYRRSVRIYRNRPVARELVAELLEMVRRAPTAKNLQPVSWLLVDDAEKIHHLAELTVDWLRTLGEAQAAVVAAWDAGEDIIMRKAPLLVLACVPEDGLKPVEDACIAMTSLELAAASHGIGGFWLGFFMTAVQYYPPLQEALGLEAGQKLRAGLGLGWPKLVYRRLPERKEAVVRWL